MEVLADVLAGGVSAHLAGFDLLYPADFRNFSEEREFLKKLKISNCDFIFSKLRNKFEMKTAES